MLLSSGLVIRHKLETQSNQVLFSVKSNFSYEDGGFDLEAKSSIYTMDQIVVVVNDYKRHGYIHYPEKYYALHLFRTDYYADISCYPIALFKNENGIPHVIYGIAWNHVQIMNLDTRQVLTAAKSLIEEHAEERHVEFYTRYKEDNKLPWPSPFDYFYGRILLSPDNSHFLSAGWAWGSCDLYSVFNTEHFIHHHRIAARHFPVWEHYTRAVCWLDSQTIAVAYNPSREGDEGTTDDTPAEIRIYNISKSMSEPERTIQTGKTDLTDARFYFDNRHDSIIAISSQTGTHILSLDGRILFQDEHFKPDDYDQERDLFIQSNDKEVFIYELERAM